MIFMKILNKSLLFFKKNIVLLLFIVIGFLVYANSLNNRFVWDDLSLIVNNKYLQSPDFFREILTGKFFNTNSLADSQEIFYRPLSMLVYSVLYRLFSLNSFPFHLISLLLHITNAYLIYRLFLSLFSQEKLPKTISFFAGIIFIIHPVNVETVAYISSLAEVLYVFWCLLLLNIMVTPWFGKCSSLSKFILIFLLVFLSLISKESAIVIIPIVILFITSLKKNMGRMFLASSLTSLSFYLYLRYFIAHISNNFTGQFPIMKAPLLYRLQTIPSEFVFYLQRFFWPQNLNIAQHWVVERVDFFNFTLPLSILLITSFLIFLFLKKNRSSLFFFLLSWLVIPLGLIMNIIPLDMTAAERWFYFPQIGLLGILVFFSLKVIRHKPKMFGVFLITILFIIMLLGTRTVVRNFDWTNSYTLYSSGVINDRSNFYLENNLASALYDRNDYQGAEQHLLKSINLYQSWFPPYKNLGHLYFFQKKYDLAEKYYQQAIRLGSYDPKNYTNYATILIFQNKYQEAFNLLSFYRSFFPGNEDFLLHLIFLSNKLRFSDKEIYFQQELLKLKKPVNMHFTP